MLAGWMQRAEAGGRRTLTAFGTAECAPAARRLTAVHREALARLTDGAAHANPDADPVLTMEGMTDWERLTEDARALVHLGSAGWTPELLDQPTTEALHALFLVGMLRAARRGDEAGAATCLAGAHELTVATWTPQDYMTAYFGLILRQRELALHAKASRELGRPIATPPSPSARQVAAVALYRHASRRIEMLESCHETYVAIAGSCETARKRGAPLVEHVLRVAECLESGCDMTPLREAEVVLRRDNRLAKEMLDTQSLVRLVEQVEEAELAASGGTP